MGQFEGPAGRAEVGEPVADGGDGSPDEGPTAPADASVVEHYRERAADLVAEWSGYELDYSVESLVRLDRLAADRYDHADPEGAPGDSPDAPGDRAGGDDGGGAGDGGGTDGGGETSDGGGAGDPLAVEEASLRMPADGSPMTFGGYLAELFRRHHGAEWRADGPDEVLVLEGPDGAVELEPVLLAAACLAGRSSFVDVYAHAAADAGLTPPL